MAGLLTPILAQPVADAATGQTVDLRVLLIGGAGGAAADPPTAAWAAGLTSQGVAFKEVDATGGIPAETVALPALDFFGDARSVQRGRVRGEAGRLRGRPAQRARSRTSRRSGSVRSTATSFRDTRRPATVGLNAISDAQTGAGISSTTATLTAAGLTTFAALNGPGADRRRRVRISRHGRRLVCRPARPRRRC